MEDGSDPEHRWRYFKDREKESEKERKVEGAEGKIGEKFERAKVGREREREREWRERE